MRRTFAQAASSGEVREIIGSVSDAHAAEFAQLYAANPSPNKLPTAIAGFKRVLDGADVRHVLRSHGNAAREAARKPPQAPITMKDFERIPQILAKGRMGRLAANTGTGVPTYEVKAVLGRYEYTYVEQVWRKEQAVGLKTFHKKPK